MTKPSITCPANATVSADGTCAGTVGTYSPVSVNDNCTASPTVSQSPASSTGLNGHNDVETVTLTANDGNGNTQTCTLTVTLKDVTKPSITCPVNATVSADGTCAGTVGSHSPASVSDNCTASPTVSQSPASSTALNGHNDVETVTLTANDGNGNTQICTLTVTLKDVTKPSITCPANATVSADGTCAGTVGSHSPASVSDNCNASPTVSQSPASSTALNGHNDVETVMLTANDGNGNTQTCTLTVTLKDVTKPSITCPANATVSADGTCAGTVGTYSPVSVNDNCTASPTVSQSPASSTALNGHNDVETVTLTANDGNGNTQTCTFTVTLKDVTKPSITCPANATVSADGTCAGTVGSHSPASVSDNCTASPTVSQSPASSTALNGHNDVETVTLTANDGNGNTQTCTFTVTLKDVTKPNITCPANATVSADGSCAGTVGSHSPASVSDNCNASPTVSQSPASSTALNGHNDVETVTLTANDGNGNTQTCTFTVTLKDVTKPSITCPANQNIPANASCSGMVGSWNPASVSDNCGPISLTQTPSPTTMLNGHNASALVTLTASDGNSNTSSCSFTVTLKDLSLPVAKCKSITANLGLNGTVTVAASAVDNGSSDNCSFSLLLTPNTFNCSNIGINIVTLRATDVGGNTANCTAKVTVKDLTGPSAKCKNPTIFLNSGGQATLTTAQVDNGSTDNCGISSMSISKTSFNCSEISGTQPVTLSLTDVNGNSSSCLSYVTVKDAIAPTAICEDVTVVLGPNGKVTVYGEDLAFNSFDNCSVWSYSPIAKVYTTANLGANNLTVTVKDWSGNASTCVSVVTVILPSNGDFHDGGEGKGGNPGIYDFVVYPNPTNGEAMMAFQLPAEQAFSFRIFDTSGRMIYSREDLGMEGENFMPLRLEDIPSGVYLIDFHSDKWKVQKRLVLQRD
ncbi:MAG: HYR domain-containing protein [Saprospiraceae bacterium]